MSRKKKEFAMNEGRERFYLKIILIVPLMIGALIGIGLSVEATTARFGGMGWLIIVPGVLMLAAGVLGCWATVITRLDHRGLRRYRADALDSFEDGQTVALSGEVRISGEPLFAPFSQKPCAALSYQVTGQGIRGADSHRRQQLCAIGFGLADAVLDCGTRSFPLRAVPDVGTDLREIATNSEWRERAMKLIKQAAKDWERAPEADARGKRIDAGRFAQPRLDTKLFVAATRGTSTTLGIIEDHVPVGQPVTVMATYDAGSGSLRGGQLRDMKVFAGHIDDKLAVLEDEWRKGLMICIPLALAGMALLTLASWWPI